MRLCIFRFVPKLRLKTLGMSSIARFSVPQTAAVDATELSRLHEVKLSLDSGRTVTPGHSWSFTLLNSRTEVSILRPTTGPVTGDTLVKVYGIMFVDVPSFLCKWTLTLSEPYIRQFEIFSVAFSALLEVVTKKLFSFRYCLTRDLMPSSSSTTKICAINSFINYFL